MGEGVNINWTEKVHGSQMPAQPELSCRSWQEPLGIVCLPSLCTADKLRRSIPTVKGHGQCYLCHPLIFSPASAALESRRQLQLCTGFAFLQDWAVWAGLSQPIPAWDAQQRVSVTCTYKPAACNSPLGVGIGLRYQGEVLGIVFMGKPQPLCIPDKYRWLQFIVAQLSCICSNRKAHSASRIPSGTSRVMGHCIERAETGWLCCPLFFWFSEYEFFSSWLCSSGDTEKKALKEFVSKY